MKKAKKALSLMLVVVMIMGLVACGGNNSTSNSGDTGNTGTNGSGTGSTSTEGVTGQGTKVEASTDAAAEYAKELTISISIGTLDPGDSWTAGREAYQRCVFDTLIAHDDATGEITMQLAESVEWTDESCNRIHVILRDDIKFSTGDPVTAEDVQFSFDRATYSTLTNHYDSIDVVSDTELYINLKHSYTAFLPLLSRACCMVVSKDATEKAIAEQGEKALATIGSGPYVYDMETYVAASSITLVPNEYYWGEKNPTEKIHFIKIAESAADAAALQTGEVNLIFNVGEASLPGLEADENITVTKYNAYNFVYLVFNDRGETESLTEEEKNFRRAVACAINKEDIIAGLGGGMIMTSMWRYDDGGYIANESDFEHDLSYNPEKAKEYLAQAGGKTSFTCLVDSSRSYVKIPAMIIQEYLRQVGITMEIVETDSTGYTKMTGWNNMEQDAGMQSNLFTLEANACNFFNESTTNRAHMRKTAILDALDEIAVTNDKAKKDELFQGIMKEIHESVSWLPLCWREMNYAYTKGLENFSLTASPTYILRDIRLRTN